MDPVEKYVKSSSNQNTKWKCEIWEWYGENYLIFAFSYPGIFIWTGMLQEPDNPSLWEIYSSSEITVTKLAK